MTETGLPEKTDSPACLKLALFPVIGYAFWWTYLYSNGINGPSWFPVTATDPGTAHLCRFFTYLSFAFVIAVIWVARNRLASLVSRRRLIVECSVVASLAFFSFSLGAFQVLPSWSMFISASFIGASTAIPIVAYWEKIVSLGTRRACVMMSGALVLGSLCYLVVAGIGIVAPQVATGLCALCPILSLVSLFRDGCGAVEEKASETGSVQLQKYPYVLLFALFAYGIVFGLILAMNRDGGPYSFWALIVNAVFVVIVAFSILFFSLKRREDEFGIARIYRLILPLVGTGFILLPLFGSQVLSLSSGIVIAGYACSRIFSATVFASISQRLSITPLASATMACATDAGGIAIGSFLGWLFVFATGMGAQVGALQHAALVVCGFLTLLTTLFLTDSGVSSVWGFCAAVQKPPSNTDSGSSVQANVLSRAAEYRLTPRENEVFVALVHGKNAQAIAEELVISKATVLTHIKNIYAKADVHSRAELINRVYETPYQQKEPE